MTNIKDTPGLKGKSKRAYALLAGGASLATVAVLILAKGFAYLQSGSVSILGSLIDSLMDAAVSLINLMAIRYSLKPADQEHRYGHGKIEGLAALFQAAFISGAGVFLVLESLQRFTSPEPAELNFLIIGIMLFSMILSLGLIVVQKFILKYAPSLAVEAEQAHYAGDVAMNGGLVLILLAMNYGAPLWADSAFAILIAAYLGNTAREIAIKGLDMLLDRELPDELRAQILDIINAHPEIIGVHDLRTRKSGMDVHIVFDLEIDADYTLRKAHAIALAVEKKILKLFPYAEVMIHTDPAGVPHTDSRHPASGVHD